MLWRRSRKDRAEDRSDREIAALRAMLEKREAAAARQSRMYRRLLGMVGVLMFTLGLVTGLYGTPIKDRVIALWESKADAGYAAYRKGN